MTETRAALLSNLACLVLVTWMVLRPPPQAVLDPQPASLPAQPPDARVTDQLRELSTQLEALRAQIANQVVSRSEAPVVAPSAGTTPDGGLGLLQQDVQALKFAVQALTDLQAEATTGGVSHSLPELRREFPTTHWGEWEKLLQRALAAPGASELGYLKSDKSPILAELLMLRPRDVLRMFGSPTRTQLENGRFVWFYQSPQLDGEGQPERTAEVVFDKGYVWNVVTDVSGS